MQQAYITLGYLSIQCYMTRSLKGATLPPDTFINHFLQVNSLLR